MIDPVEGIDDQPARDDRGRRDQRGSSRRTRRADPRSLILAPAFVDPHVHLRTPGREDEETIAIGHGGGRRRWVLRDRRDAEHRPRRRLGGGARRARRARPRRGGGPHRVHGRDHEGTARGGADRDGGARRARCGRVHRRREAGRLGRCDAQRSRLQRRRLAPAGAARGGADAVRQRSDARGLGVRGARPHRLAGARGDGDDRARPRPCCIRAAATAYHARVGCYLCRRDPRRQGTRCRGHGRGDATPPRASPTRPFARSTRTRR